MDAALLESLARRLSDALHLSVAPVAIAFGETAPAGVEPFGEPVPPAAADGRTGRVPAGCVFWMRAVDGSFTTVPEDHRNCSVGSLTHGMVDMDEAARMDDVAQLMASGWVTGEMVPAIPTVRERPAYVSYGPLTDAAFDPDVVLLRVNGRQMMVLSDAVGGMSIEGKPQCHIVAVAKEEGQVVGSVGCALSRVRTGMSPEEMTAALPAARLEEIVESVERTAAVDGKVARYAASDSRRFD
ncbi:MAG: DUF169 domain-containing protein [Actinomycetota bacterium]|nr:DUF169 domain-containing protein [Actinomycetota bacterium]